MSKGETSLAKRLEMLIERCGSRRALARFLGLSDMTLKYWQEGAPPLPSKLRKAAQHSRISFDWFAHGKGSAEKELAKCRTVSVDEAAVTRLAEEAPTVQEAATFITQHGEPADVQMVEEILSAAVRRIRERKASAAAARKSVKYK